MDRRGVASVFGVGHPGNGGRCLPPRRVLAADAWFYARGPGACSEGGALAH